MSIVHLSPFQAANHLAHASIPGITMVGRDHAHDLVGHMHGPNHGYATDDVCEVCF